MNHEAGISAAVSACELPRNTVEKVVEAYLSKVQTSVCLSSDGKGGARLRINDEVYSTTSEMWVDVPIQSDGESARGDEVENLKALIAEVGNICNGIRARDGAPEGWCHEYFNYLVENMHSVCDGSCLEFSWKHKYTPPTHGDSNEQ